MKVEDSTGNEVDLDKNSAQASGSRGWLRSLESVLRVISHMVLKRTASADDGSGNRGSNAVDTPK